MLIFISREFHLNLKKKMKREHAGREKMGNSQERDPRPGAGRLDVVACLLGRPLNT